MTVVSKLGPTSTASILVSNGDLHAQPAYGRTHQINGKVRNLQGADQRQQKGVDSCRNLFAIEAVFLWGSAAGSGILRDILKIAAGVVLGLIAYALIGAIFTELNPTDRAARDLLERQFAPSN